MEAYGKSGKLLKWLGNFLSNRLQRVIINGCTSKWSKVLSGIPQGSILGLILFIIFVNDLPEVINGLCKLFADDCKVYSEVKTKEDQEQLQSDIDKL